MSRQSSTHGKKRTPRKLSAETLEPRRLLAAAVFDSSKRLLTVTGTTASETIYLRNINDSISVAKTNISSTISIKSGKTTVSSIPLSQLSKIVVKAGKGNDTINGDSGNFDGQSSIPIPLELDGEDGNDTLKGSSGRDILLGGKGKDTLHGNSGDDNLLGQDDDDTLIGGADDDTLNGGFGYDDINGGSGTDLVTYKFYTKGVTLSLSSNVVSFPAEKSKRTETLTSIENAEGSYGNDTIFGSNLANTLKGLGGRDTIFGMDGNDVIYGGEGNDTLWGGDGTDVMYGEGGSDRLTGGDGNDRINGGLGIDTFYREIGKPGFNLSEDSKDENEEVDDPQQIAGAFLADPQNPGRDHYLDIDQQYSPICSFMASLAAVSNWTGKFPSQGFGSQDLVSRIKRSGDNYLVPLFIKGAWKNIEVDGYWTEDYAPAGPLWTTLYLKAWLQVHKIKTHDSSGNAIAPKNWKGTGDWQVPAVALRALTGLPTAEYKSAGSNPQDFAEKIAAGRVYVASSKNKTSPEVVANHAYMVLSVQKISNVWYIDLYNPTKKDTKTSTTYPTGAVTGANDGLVRLTYAQYLANFSGQSRNTN